LIESIQVKFEICLNKSEMSLFPLGRPSSPLSLWPMNPHARTPFSLPCLSDSVECHRSPLPPSNGTDSSLNHRPVVATSLGELCRPSPCLMLPLYPLLSALSTLSPVGYRAAASHHATVPATGTVTAPSACATGMGHPATLWPWAEPGWAAFCCAEAMGQIRPSTIHFFPLSKIVFSDLNF
jgi:hypothetical protein